MECIIKFSFEELELLIEVMQRNRVDNDNENKLRHDLRTIRSNAEDQKKRLDKEMAARPKEEVRLMPNPTSSEHIK
tara:strand:+ start:451 stop:678 length:228 start_codon:yes stop_codon:yes gene_type:complete